MKLILPFLALLTFSCSALGQVRSASYYIDKANDEIEKKDYNDALETLTIGIRELPDSLMLLDMRGTLYEAFQRYEDAINDFSKGIEKSNDDKLKSHLYSNRGGSKTRIRDFEGAYDDLLLATELDSSNIDALNNIAAVCDEVGRSDETLKYLDKIIKIDSNYVPAYVNLGFKYQEMGQHDIAIKHFDKAVKLAPDEALGYSNRSFSKMKSGDLKGAMKDINKSIKLMPSNSYAYKIRALIHLEKGKTDNACDDLNEALKLGYSQQYGMEVKKLLGQNCQ